MSGKALAFAPDELERLCVLSDAAGVALWCWRPTDDGLTMNGRARKLLGVAAGAWITFADLAARIVAEDFCDLAPAFDPTHPSSVEFVIDFRISREEDTRWVSAHGGHARDAAGMRITFMILSDVTESKRLEERRRLFVIEMRHRVKNSFAIASALTSMVARSARTTATMALDLQSRFEALCQANDLACPAEPGAGNPQLRDLISVLLLAYERGPGRGERICVDVPDVLVGEVAVTTLALVFHELGTNSVKYGSLSRMDGLVDVVGGFDENFLSITWTERGGPPASRPDVQSGFGTALIERSLAWQLGGSASFAWEREGLIASLRLRRSRMAD